MKNEQILKKISYIYLVYGAWIVPSWWEKPLCIIDCSYYVIYPQNYIYMDKKVLIGGAALLAVAGYLVYSKKKCASTCSDSCSTTSCNEQSTSINDPFALTNEDYSAIVGLSYDEALLNIAEGCDISLEEATARLEANQETISSLKSDIETFILEKSSIIETQAEAKIFKLDIFDKFIARIKSVYATNNERQQFFDSIFSDIRESLSSSEPTV